jgi:hypothetical protein
VTQMTIVLQMCHMDLASYKVKLLRTFHNFFFIY